MQRAFPKGYYSSTLEAIVHRVVEVGTPKRRTLACTPVKQEKVVDGMMQFSLAKFGWEGVNCPKCLGTLHRGIDEEEVRKGDEASKNE